MTSALPTRPFTAQELALFAAVGLYQTVQASLPTPNVKGVLAAAGTIREWLIGPSGLVVTINPVVTQGTVLSASKGQPVQLTDTQQVTLTVQATDAKGSPTTGDAPTTLAWTIDNPTVATLQVSTDTLTCTVIAGTVGSGVVTVTAGSLSATIAVDVIAGGAAKFVIGEGVPVEQPPTTPAT